MAYWLLKSEPHAWSWDQQKQEGRKGAEWDGVRNFQARNNMRAMRQGDLAFFYHSGEEKSVVGIVKVVKEAHPDSTDGTGQWECVDVAAVRDLARPVTLTAIKAEPSLKSMVLVRNSRLSARLVP
jgi:predicted RNA-binding protein with PUA-like domain